MDPIIELGRGWLNADTLYEVRVGCEQQSEQRLAARVEIERRRALKAEEDYTPMFTLNELLDVGIVLLKVQNAGNQPSRWSGEIEAFGELVRDILEAKDDGEAMGKTHVQEVYEGVAGDAEVNI